MIAANAWQPSTAAQKLIYNHQSAGAFHLYISSCVFRVISTPYWCEISTSSLLKSGGGGCLNLLSNVHKPINETPALFMVSSRQVNCPYLSTVHYHPVILLWCGPRFTLEALCDTIQDNIPPFYRNAAKKTINCQYSMFDAEIRQSIIGAVSVSNRPSCV